MLSLGALAHFDYNLAGAHSYEQAFRAIRALGLPMDAIEQQYRRMAFNIVARNQDDHVKNIAFLMDKAGRWSLAPAFDLTYAYNPDGAWTSSHQMTMNGKRDGFADDDFEACAKTASMRRNAWKEILDEVRDAIAHWSDHADDAGIDRATRDRIGRTLRR
jgi:serine/threonine-protein kinase HipA